MRLATQSLLSRAAALLLGVLFLALANLQAQAPPETVGRIEGDDIAVKGQVSLVRENDRSTTVLASGSEVTVRSGHARILLVEGGEIGVCGPANLTLLKAGASITLALNFGRIQVSLGNQTALSIYTPLIVAVPLAIANGPRHATIGLETSGTMCVLARSGAVRLEQQFRGNAVVVPEAGEIAMPDGQLESASNATGTCHCEELLAKTEPLPAPKPAELSMLAPASPTHEKPPAKNDEPPKPPATEVPTWKVLMPPLTFDAAKPVPAPEPSPETILLVREVRVEPAVVFSGRVEPVRMATLASTRAAIHRNDWPSAPEKKQGGLFTKIGHFFRRLFGGRCVGTGCGGGGNRPPASRTDLP